MPYTSKRKRQLQDVRKTKVQKRGESSKEESRVSSLELGTLLENLEDYDTEQDEKYDPETEEFDEESSIQTHAREWADSLCLFFFFFSMKILMQKTMHKGWTDSTIG